MFSIRRLTSPWSGRLRAAHFGAAQGRVRLHEVQRPLWLGTLFAPLAAPIAYSIGTVVSSGDSSLKIGDVGVVIIFCFAIATPVSYLGSVLLGLPLALILKSRRALSFRNCLISGIGAGGLTFIAFCIATAGPFAQDYPQLSDLSMWFVVGAGLGASVAIAFALIIGIPLRTRERGAE